ncbi:hypothetical protein B0H19DRAFT_14365 [Mycena capillaripes]|nr:hypothetical protein B0H19DRAFT_14365 [Mycena capillaripes]
MKGTLTGLAAHLKRHALNMHTFYEILKSRNTPLLSAEEIEVAEGQKTFANNADFEQFIRAYTDEHQQTLRESFERASAKAIGPWNQAKFERLLV